MAKTKLIIHECYQHYKGGRYKLLHIGRLEKDGDNGEEMAIYWSESEHKTWIRPLSEFQEKFTLIES